MNIRKKSKVFALTLAAFALSSSMVVNAASSFVYGPVSGSSTTSTNYSTSYCAAATQSSDSSVAIYAGAHFSNNEGATSKSSLTYGYAHASTSVSGDSRAYAYGEHGYLYNGPRVTNTTAAYAY